MWDYRSDNPLLQTIPQPDKVYAMSTESYRLVVGLSGRIVNIFDVRKLDEPEQQKESPLKYQTRTVACIQKKKFSFRCHRTKDADGTDIVHPVNALAFHPTHGTFASGGADGQVITWDGNAMKKLVRSSPHTDALCVMKLLRRLVTVSF